MKRPLSSTEGLSNLSSKSVFKYLYTHISRQPLLQVVNASSFHLHIKATTCSTNRLSHDITSDKVERAT